MYQLHSIPYWHSGCYRLMSGLKRCLIVIECTYCRVGGGDDVVIV